VVGKGKPAKPIAIHKRHRMDEKRRRLRQPYRGNERTMGGGGNNKNNDRVGENGHKWSANQKSFAGGRQRPGTCRGGGGTRTAASCAMGKARTAKRIEGSTTAGGELGVKGRFLEGEKVADKKKELRLGDEKGEW